MKFEHLIQINDPKLHAVDFLSRQQVWLGLVSRAYKPEHFIIGLIDAQIDETVHQGNVTTLARTLDFGSFQINDTITLEDETRTVNTVHANEFCGASSMTITIEEPEPDQLWLRFEYQVEASALDPAESETMQGQIDEARRQAYKAADIDTVKLIRQLALSVPDIPPSNTH